MNEEIKLLPINKYLMEAAITWFIDSGLTPHLVVDTTDEKVNVPVDFINNDQIILNISVSAVRNFVVDHEGISFSSKFGGKPMNVFFPVASVIGVLAGENKMMFPLPPMETENEPEPTEKPKDEPNGGLRLV